MPALRLLQEGPNMNLSWLLYSLLGFLALVMIVGAWVSRGRGAPGSKSEREARTPSRKERPPRYPRSAPAKERSKR
jgi:hypothetical protein